MSAPVVTVDELRCVAARFVFPYVGVWFADLDLDPDVVSSVPPQGPATIVIGAAPPVTLLGFIDPLGSGSFGATARMRVVGGVAGWQRQVPAQHFPSPGTTQTVYAATGALVGEKVVVAIPSSVPENYVRLAGFASDVLRDEPSWWVDPVTGVTTVGPRPPLPPDVSLELMTWDAGAQVAIARCDTLVLPGTIIVDPRIGGGKAIVRDVEQRFDANGSTAECMCSTNSVSRLLVSLATLIEKRCKTGLLKIARYRFVQDAGGPTSVGLQAVDRDALTGAASPYPDLLPLTTWTGVAGIIADLPPSLEVLVGFVDGDPQQPVVVGYSTLAPPVKMTVDATVQLVLGQLAQVVQIGGNALSITIGGPAALPVARATDPVQAGPFAGAITAGSLKVSAD